MFWRRGHHFPQMFNLLISSGQISTEGFNFVLSKIEKVLFFVLETR
jgi:hypothetical protein